ncbi:MAG: glycosyltransferase family 4 protein [Armatimonadota bacterium]|nr:MAG: glycosyltransferase family 4 protein [Armatimonadota bacterium]
MTGPLRIVQYITPSHIGGAEVHVSALSERLRARGHQVTVVCPKGRALVAELAARGLRLRTPRTMGKLDPVTLARLVRWLRQDRTQVIHTHLSTASLLGSFAARMRGIPALATVHGLNTRTCFNWAHAIIAVSNAVKQHLVAQGMAPDRITIVHNGVDLRSMSRADESASVKETWRIPAGAPVLITVGRLTPKKGHRDLMQALASLARDPRWSNLRLLIVGAGALLPALERDAEWLGLAERVVFAGFQRDVLPFLQAADIFVLPSIQEGLSLSALEAMALGKPVVACRVGGTPEVVVDGETGVLVSPSQPDELGDALARLLEEPDRARAMGEAGRRRVRAAFDFEQMVSKIEDIYRRVISHHAAAP